MSKLQIWRAKPNPAGKDKNKQTPKADQLNGEWVEIKNLSGARIAVAGVKLAHTLFDTNGNPEPRPEVYWTGPQGLVLEAGEVVRVHTGRSRDAGSMHVEDANGTDHHAFAEHGSFKLNNREGDKLYLDGPGSQHDEASYDPEVREGAVLTRVGAKLVDLESGGVKTDSAKEWKGPAIIGGSRKAA